MKARTKGGTAQAAQGEILLDGPHGVVVSMTPEAARSTARSLNQAADESEGNADDDPDSPGT